MECNREMWNGYKTRSCRLILCIPIYTWKYWTKFFIFLLEQASATCIHCTLTLNRDVSGHISHSSMTAISFRCKQLSCSSPITGPSPCRKTNGNVKLHKMIDLASCSCSCSVLYLYSLWNYKSKLSFQTCLLSGYCITATEKQLIYTWPGNIGFFSMFSDGFPLH